MQGEELVGREDDIEAHATMAARIGFAQWVAEQVASLRRLGFQVADKSVGRALA